MIAGILFSLVSLGAAQQPTTVQRAISNANPGQVSYGTCSPNISNVSGNITIQFSGNGCLGIDPAAIKHLNEFLADFPKTQRRLQELLDKKDLELADKMKQIEDWSTKYRQLSQRMEEQPADDELSKRAASLLKEGDLDGAGDLLDQILARDEKRVNQAAQDHFNRAQAYELKFQPLRALPHYEEA